MKYCGKCGAAFSGTTAIVIGAIAALGAFGIMAEGALVAGLSSLLSAATIILFGTLILSYKKSVTAYK